MKTILVVEDEFSIRSFLCFNLRRKKYKVLEADSGEVAMQILIHEDLDMVILDIMLPGMNGYQVCEEIRSKYPNTGIIMLTARSQEEDKVKGLTGGADDYLTKPFSMVELEARIVSLIRRLDYQMVSKDTKTLTSGPFTIDQRKHKIYRNGKELRLTPTEFCLLEFLIGNKNRIFTRNQLLDEIWGVHYVGDSKVVDVNIRRIRRKIEGNPAEPIYLCTEWGYGYQWKE